MEKYLLIESESEGVAIIEIASITDEELGMIKPIVLQMANSRYSAHHGDVVEDEMEYGHLPGYELFVQYIPDGGIGTITKIQVIHVVQTLLK